MWCVGSVIDANDVRTKEISMLYMLKREIKLNITYRLPLSPTNPHKRRLAGFRTRGRLPLPATPPNAAHGQKIGLSAKGIRS